MNIDKIEVILKFSPDELVNLYRVLIACDNTKLSPTEKNVKDNLMDTIDGYHKT